jgi:hypothetical protein
MIPLTVCQIEAWPNILTGVFIVTLAGITGLLLPRFFQNNGALVRRAAPIVIGCSLPALLFLGVWPFNPSWRYDCGATPDPNVIVLFASLAFPIIFGLIYLLSHWALARTK